MTHLEALMVHLDHLIDQLYDDSFEWNLKDTTAFFYGYWWALDVFTWDNAPGSVQYAYFSPNNPGDVHIRQGSGR